MIRDYLRTLPLFSRNSRLILVSSAILGFSYTGIYMLLMTLLLLRLGYGTEFIGVFVSSGALSFALFSFLAGVVGRRLGSRSTMIGGFAVTAVGISMLSLSPLIGEDWRSVWLIFFCMFRELGNSFYLVNSSPALMSATTQTERSYVFSMRAAMQPMVAVVGSFAGGSLPQVNGHLFGWSVDDPLSYSLALLLAGIAMIPGVWALAMTGRSDTTATSSQLDGIQTGDDVAERVRTHEPAESSSPVPYGPLVAMAAVGLLFITAMAAVVSFFNVYMDEELHVPTATIGILLAVGHLVAVPIALTTAAVVERWGYARTFIFSASGVCLSVLPLALVPQWWAAGISIVGLTAMSAMSFPAITVYQQELVDPHWRPIMSGVAMTSVASGWTITSSGVGYLIPLVGYGPLFLLAALTTGIGVGVFWVYSRGQWR